MLTAKQLDRMDCQVPGCDHTDHSALYIHSRCHLNAGVAVRYDKLTHSLHMACNECKKSICSVEVK